MILAGETISGQFGVSDPETGGVVDADALPTAKLVVAGADSAAVVTVTRLAVGRYRFDVEPPALADGDVLQVRVSAIVDTVPGEGIVWAGEGGAARPPTIEDIEGATLEAASFSDEALESIASAVYSRLTSRTASVVAALNGDDLTILRGDTVEIVLTGLGDISTRTALWFTLKKYPARQADSEALVQVAEDDGALVLNGDAPADPDYALLEVTDEVAGDVTITLRGILTADLDPAKDLSWDIQQLDADGEPRTLASGAAKVTADVTRAVE